MIEIHQASEAYKKRSEEARLSPEYRKERERIQNEHKLEPDDMQCENCFYFENDEGAYGGICRRYPPIVYDETTQQSFHPEVDPDGWCGEFVRKRWNITTGGRE